MYECPNCNGNLKFDIISQKLYCFHCNGTMDPYLYQKEKDALESPFYDVNVFSCPQCGGKLLTEDTTAATFCNYCGSSTILDKRLSKERRPKYIIPFTKTLDDCKASYEKMVKWTLFLPKDLKDKNHIEKFRAIYMPYWTYSFKKNGKATFKGQQNTGSYGGTYDCFNHYDLECDVKAEYKDFYFDASSSFSDSLSNDLEPFDLKQKKPFHPAFLSGFYADCNDVKKDWYREDAEDAIKEHIKSQICATYPFTTYHCAEHIEEYPLDETLKPEQVEEELVLLPIWFLSYRKKDRVAYAVVNGQTGKAAADLPIDLKKFAISTLLWSIPIIALLNLFLVLTPTKLLLTTMFLTIIFTILADKLGTDVLIRESWQDKIIQTVYDLNPFRPKHIIKETWKTFWVIVSIFWQIPAYFIAFAVVDSSLIQEFTEALFLGPAPNINPTQILFLLITLGHIIIMGWRLSREKTCRKNEYIDEEIYKKTWRQKYHMMLKLFLAIIVAAILILINPAPDYYFYGCTIFCLLMIGLTIWDLLKFQNLLTTRKLPQLNKRGGEDYA